jgi:hypothetical protein
MERDLNSRSPVCETGILTTRLPIQKEIYLDLYIFILIFYFFINFTHFQKNIEKDNIRFPRRNHVGIYFDSQSGYQF